MIPEPTMIMTKKALPINSPINILLFIKITIDKNLLKIKEFEITRVEAYDNSHTSGKNSVGVMVVADKEGLSPKNYRKFNIRYDLKETKNITVLMIII